MARSTGTPTRAHRYEQVVCKHERTREFRDENYVTTADGRRFLEPVFTRKCTRCRRRLGVRVGERVPLDD